MNTLEDLIENGFRRIYKAHWKYEYNGKKYMLKDLCEMFDTSEPAIRYRMIKMGLTLEQALSTPKKTNGRPRKAVTSA